MSKITVHLLSFNESFLLPQVDKWWRDRFSDIEFKLFDNYSIDDTPNLANDLGWKVQQFDTGGKMSDLIQYKIKNICWKNTDSEYVWVSDFDEVPHFDEYKLSQHDFNVVKCVGWEMIDNTPTIQEACYGFQNGGYSKCTLFKPYEIEDMNYEVGAHIANPVPKNGYRLKINDTDFDLLHMKWFNPHHALNRASLLGGRQSEDNIKKNWSYHFALPVEVHNDYYNTHFKNRIKIR